MSRSNQAQVIHLDLEEHDINEMTEGGKKELITVDFVEVDHCRMEVRRIINNMRKRNLYPKGCYDYSQFYIGRGVTRVSFYNLYCSPFQMSNVIAHLKRYFTHSTFKYYREGTNLHIYFRGERIETIA